ncbi:MAG TPA: 3-oxoacyl-ACP reductase [Noviherbaspirillum sp.]|nr:3-oxoacyl-ACP reductase [Noviherbaspirillum sp.]
MSDLLSKLHRNPLSRPFMRVLGLPNPVNLARAEGGYVEEPFAGRTALLLPTAGGYAFGQLAQALEQAGASLRHSIDESDTAPLDIVVMDATGLRAPEDCRALYDGFQPVIRRIARNGRVLLLAALPDEAADPVAAAVARGVEGFSRSLAKELGRKGVCVNLGYVSPAAVDRLDGPLRFFCGPQSTYVSGQAVRIRERVAAPAALLRTRALEGKTALVTGAARGIGMAAAERLAEEGARVICLDIPTALDDLNDTCARVGAHPLALDISTSDAPSRLAQALREPQWRGGVDIVVHNAGITRDRTLAKMSAREWDMVIAVNLAAIAAIDETLVSETLLRDEGRIVCVSSISGVAGNFGQTNYAASKAALIGYAAAMASRLAARGICINAVAPGFIETAMTGKMPFFTREIGRRLNSLQQGGQPRDVAELITFLATPGAHGISGETIRVCGQGMVGA